MAFETLSAASLRVARPVIGSEMLSVCVAVYLAVFANRTFWTKAVDYLGLPSIALVLLLIGIVALFSAICVTVSAKYLAKPIFILLVTAAAIASWFMDHFGTIIDIDMIRNAAETTGPEAGHLLTAGFLLHLLVFAAVPSALIAIVRIRHRPILQKVKWNTVIILACLSVFVSVSLANVRTFAATTREHRDLVATLNPVIPIVSTLRYAMATESEKNIVIHTLGTDARVAAPTASGRPRVTVIVAGETARAESFSLNGYSRVTNPELSQQDISYFTDTSSCGTATGVSLPCMFSVFGRSNYNRQKGLETENLLDVLSHAGITVEWWDNNTGSKAIAQRIAYTSLADANDPRFCVNRECLDDVFLDRLSGWLDAVKGDSVLVLHQLGSHGPAYFQRYPDAYRKFTPDCRTAELGNCTRDEIVNAYDNSILYTDHILSAIIGMLKARENKMAASMIYMSDHGESLGEHGLYLHGAPYMIAPSQQTHVPFVLWNGKEARAGIDQACLLAKTGQPQSHDNLFHTVLGMMDVETKAYDPALDILSSCRRGAGFAAAGGDLPKPV